MAKLSEVLTQHTEYINSPDAIEYPKLSVKLYGKGVVLDAPTDGTKLKMKRHQLAKAGQVILSEIWGKKGAIGLVPTEGEGALCTSHFFLFDIRHDRVDSRYLGLLFRRNYLEGQLSAGAKGTTGYAAVRPKHLLAAEIPLPPLPEQRRIVARIEELTVKIEEVQCLRKQAVEETEALWESGASRILDQIADKFPCQYLGELVRICGGGTPAKSNPDYWAGTVPWISPKDMKSRILHDSIDHISEKATLESSAKIVNPGAVLVVVRGMILVHTLPAAVLACRAAINQDMKALLTRADLIPEYLCAFFWAQNARILALVEKSSHDTRKLETEKLLALKVPVPPLNVQRQIVSDLDAIQTSVDKVTRLQTETSAEIDALMPSILDRAFKGEL